MHLHVSLQVWTDAGTQVFFSYSIGHAKLVALGSYNAYKHNSYRYNGAFIFIVKRRSCTPTTRAAFIRLQRMCLVLIRLYILCSDCLSYAAVNSATSFLSGFVIFPVLGFMALQNGLHIKDVAASGASECFINQDIFHTSQG